MSLTTAMLDALVATGCTAEQIAAVVKADLAEQEARTVERRRKDAERQQKSRANRKGHKVSRDVTVTPCDERDPSPKEYKSNPHPVTPSPDGDVPLSDFPTRVVEAWNRDTAGTPLPQARPLTPDRRKHLAIRAKEHGEDAVFAAIRNMAASDFHSGKSGKWTEGNLGWLLKSPENFTKMLERASDGKSAAPISPSQKLDALAQQSALYRRLGRDEEAAEIDRETERIRRSSSIGDLTQQFRQAAH